MVLGQGISGRDLVLILGGLFLLVKSVLEIHHSIEDAGETHELAKPKVGGSFMGILIQIAILDMGVLAGLGDHRGGHGRPH